MADPRMPAFVSNDAGLGPWTAVTQQTVRVAGSPERMWLTPAGFVSLLGVVNTYMAGLTGPQLAAMNTGRPNSGFGLHMTQAGLTVLSGPDGGTALAAALNAAITGSSVQFANG
jgi:hypothetical protein